MMEWFFDQINTIIAPLLMLWAFLGRRVVRRIVDMLGEVFLKRREKQGLIKGEAKATQKWMDWYSRAEKEGYTMPPPPERRDSDGNNKE